MDRLPEELLALICEHCDHATQKALRLASKRLHEASTPLVFEHFYMGLFEYGLLSLKDLAKSPLAKHVKELTLFPDIIPSWTKESYEKAIDMRPNFSLWLRGRKSQIREGYEGTGITSCLYPGDPRKEYEALPRHSLTKAELDAGWATFNQCAGQQARWSQDREGLSFKECISLLANLSKADVQCAVPFSGRTNDWPVWKKLRRHIYVGPDDFVWRQEMDEPDYAHMSGQAALCLLEALGYRASFAGIKQVKYLSVHSSHLDPYLSLMNESASNTTARGTPAHATRYQTLLETFRHLSTLRLHIPHATVSAHVSGFGMAVETMEFLRSARHLRKLDLRYGDDEMSPDDESDSQLENLFDSDDVLFPELQSAALATNMPAEILLKFLTNHARTLRRLELRDMLVHNVNVAIEHIPRVLKLDHVYVECLWDDASRTEGEFDVNYLCVLSRGTDSDADYEHSVKAYLLGQAEVMPNIERDGGLGEIREWSEWQNEYYATLAASSDDEVSDGQVD
ncbi:hypothetical protein TI39_contig287g00024 [Zymoseptoria brevis]|uniref:F-box domain-containing protein n=1 Tax=Zymoseptoria brevis TaxID=1047168 RepID=A0A0F4GZD0_9PEZI|nr:hypothetical protein TI39_contig287g00024 [Zymoseptoria brevis]